MSRYKPRGWFGHAYQHSLAAKGISTKNYYVKKSIFSRLPFINKDEDVQKVRIVGDDGNELIEEMPMDQFREIGETLESDGIEGISEIENIMPTVDALAREKTAGLSPDQAELELSNLRELREDGRINNTEIIKAYENRLMMLAGETVS